MCVCSRLMLAVIMRARYDRFVPHAALNDLPLATRFVRNAPRRVNNSALYINLFRAIVRDIAATSVPRSRLAT